VSGRSQYGGKGTELPSLGLRHEVPLDVAWYSDRLSLLVSITPALEQASGGKRDVRETRGRCLAATFDRCGHSSIRDTMNIVILLDGFGVGGTEMNAVRTLEALARRNILVSVMHFHAEGPLLARVAASGHRLLHVPITPLWHPGIALSTLAIARALRSERATIVHTQDVYSNIIGAAAGRLVPRLSVISSRRWKDEVPNKRMTSMNAWAHRGSALVLPNSAELIGTLEAEGVRPDQIVVHGNFVDDASCELLPVARRLSWRQQLGISEAARVIGCVARLTPVKRHDILLDAFALVASADPNAVLMFIGDGESRPAIEAQVRALRLCDRVMLMGTLPNFPLPQQLFDVAVLTSHNEGFPNSLVEASAAGIPLVSTLVGGVPDVLIENVTGLGVQVADSQDTARAILALLRDEDTRDRMGAAGRALVQERFSESAAVGRLLGIYKSVSR